MAKSLAFRIKPPAEGSVFHEELERISSQLTKVNTNLGKIDVSKSLDGIHTELKTMNMNPRQIDVIKDVGKSLDDFRTELVDALAKMLKRMPPVKPRVRKKRRGP
jgi:hypothetical protein